MSNTGVDLIAWNHRALLGSQRVIRWAWPIAVLALCHAQAIASFQILNILIDPIKATLAITDTQYSLLQGLAVAIFAAMLGIPAARWADKRGRRIVILAGACGWSLATLGCAFVSDFSQLFAARILMGVGEVFLFPAALSLIGDLAPRGKLSSAVAAFGAGGPVGSAAALYGGGWILPHRAVLVDWWPALSAFEGWRIAFLLCGLTGVITVVAVLTVVEPVRREESIDAATSLYTLRTWVRNHWRAYATVSGGLLCFAVCAFATAAWGPTVLTRVHDLSVEQAGRLTGAAALIGAFALTYPSGFLVDVLHRSGRSDGILLVGTALAIGLVGLAAVAEITIQNGIGIIAWLVVYALLGIPTVLAGTALQMITPKRLRAQIMAVHLLLVNLVALSLGPFLVAIITDRFYGRATAVGYSLALIDAAAASLAALLFLVGRRPFKAGSLAVS